MLEWLSNSALAGALTTYPTLYILANAAHILSIGLLIGAILPLDLRIIGLFRGARLSVLGPFLSHSAMVGVIMAILSGAVIFTVNANEYAANPAFLTKLGLLLAGIGNAVILRANPAWHRALDDEEPRPSIKIAAGLSILIWVAAIIAGRWIGFV